MLIFIKLTLFRPLTETSITIRILEDTNHFDVISENMKMDCWDCGDHVAVLYQTLSSVHRLLKLRLLVTLVVLAGTLVPRNPVTTALWLLCT
jgi:hypothetical protein